VASRWTVALIHMHFHPQLVDLLDKSGKSLNPSLEPKEVMLEEAR